MTCCGLGWLFVAARYGFSTFCQGILSKANFEVLATDSRRRPDRVALERGDASATSSKLALEQKQREERKKRESNGDTWGK